MRTSPRWPIALSFLVLGVSAACTGDRTTTGEAAPTAIAPPPGPASEWLWDGLVLGRGDEATACFGPISASDPPAGCWGWPLRGWRWADAPDVYEFTGGLLPAEPVRQAFVRLHLRIDGDALLVIGSALPGDATTTRQPCVIVGDRDPAPIEASALAALVTSDEARVAGFYVDNLSTPIPWYDAAPPASFGAGVLIDTPAVRAWVLDAFAGSRVRLCPALRPV